MLMTSWRLRALVLSGHGVLGPTCGTTSTAWRASVDVSVDPFEKVTGLALEHPTHGLEGAEAYGFGASVLQHRDIRWCETDKLRELADAQLPFRELNIDADDDRHQMTASISVRSVVA